MMNLATLRALVASTARRRALVCHDDDRERIERGLDRLARAGYPTHTLEIRPSYVTPPGVAYVIDLDALGPARIEFEVDVS